MTGRHTARLAERKTHLALAVTALVLAIVGTAFAVTRDDSDDPPQGQTAAVNWSCAPDARVPRGMNVVRGALLRAPGADDATAVVEFDGPPELTSTDSPHRGDTRMSVTLTIGAADDPHPYTLYFTSLFGGPARLLFARTGSGGLDSTNRFAAATRGNQLSVRFSLQRAMPDLVGVEPLTITSHTLVERFQETSRTLGYFKLAEVNCPHESSPSTATGTEHTPPSADERGGASDSAPPQVAEGANADPDRRLTRWRDAYRQALGIEAEETPDEIRGFAGTACNMADEGKTYEQVRALGVNSYGMGNADSWAAIRATKAAYCDNLPIG